MLFQQPRCDSCPELWIGHVPLKELLPTQKLGPGFFVIDNGDIARCLQGRAGRQRTVLEPLENVPTFARAAPKPRGNGVSASMRRRRAWAWSNGQNMQMLASVVSRRGHYQRGERFRLPSL